MERVLESELMNDPEQARAYAYADFSEPHQAFIEHFAKYFDQHQPRRVIDFGCGAADITLRFARAYPDAVLTGVDGSQAMLKFAHEAVRRAGLINRIHLELGLITGTVSSNSAYDTVISNSLLHHLHDPAVLWRTIKQCAAPGAVVFVMDLCRPNSREQALKLVTEYASTEPEILKRDFFNSLLAAFRPEEITTQLARARLAHFKIEPVSDRHLCIYGKLP